MKRKSSIEIRDRIAAILAIVFIPGGLIGLHYDDSDWTLWVTVVPLGYLIIGLFLDFLINGNHSTYESTGNAVCCMLIITNIATIFAHSDTLFIVGRLLASFGASILIIRSTMNVEERNRETIENMSKIIEDLRKDKYRNLSTDEDKH